MSETPPVDPNLHRRAYLALVRAGYLQESAETAAIGVIVEAARRYQQDSGRLVFHHAPDHRDSSGVPIYFTDPDRAPTEAETNALLELIAVIVIPDPPESFCASQSEKSHTYGAPLGHWPRGNLTWSFNLEHARGNLDCASLLQQAFDAWSEAEPFFSFTQVAQDGDIRCAFSQVELGNTSGHAGRPGPNAEVWFGDDAVKSDSKFLGTAMHEIGHTLGLSHAKGSGVMVGMAGDSALQPNDIRAIRGMYGWQPQRRLHDRGSSDGPALITAFHHSLTSAISTLYMAWKGVEGDNQVWWSSSSNGMDWAPQRPITGVLSSHGPGLTAWYPGGAASPQLFLGWKGADDDQRLFWARSHPDQSGFEDHHRFDDRSSAARPTLAYFDGRIVMAWRGAGDDTSLWWSSFDGRSWTDQAPIPGCFSDHAPALAALGSNLTMIWKGLDRDPTHEAILPAGAGATWSPPSKVLHATRYFDKDSKPYESVHEVSTSEHPAICTCGDSVVHAFKGIHDDALWFMPRRHDDWSGPTQLPDFRSSTGPGIASLAGNPVMAWKAQHPDQDLYCSTLAR